MASDLAQTLDELFSAQAPAQDALGVLQTLAPLVEAVEPRALWLLSSSGNLVARYLPGATGPQPDLSLLVSRTRAQLAQPNRSVVAFADADAGGWVFALSLGTSGEAHLGGITRRGAGCQANLRTLAPAVEPALRLAAAALDLQARLEREEHRVTQLQREQQTLRDSYARLMDEGLNEREQRLREQRDYAAHLENEVSIRSADLQAAVQAAERANRAKTDFLTNISHELRTPMTAILGFTEQLAKECGGRQPVMDLTAVLRRNGLHLQRLIDDLLDISKIEAGTLPIALAPCALGEAIEEVARQTQPLAAARKLAFETRCDGLPPAILTDAIRLKQILLNLLDNAIKFTSAGSVLLMAGLESGGRVLVLQVQDSGSGMTPQQMEKLFTPFAQGDSSRTRLHGGTGLGLAISRRLAQMLGGTLTATSTPGLGSCFTLKLDVQTTNAAPVTAEEPIRDPAPPAASSAAPAGRILLVEDTPDNRLLINLMLKSKGFALDNAENGRLGVDQALEALAAGHPFDVILMDMQMPVLDGYGATAELRRRGYDRPIVALTAHAMACDQEKCLAAGCDEYLTKPIDLPKLLKCLGDYVSGRRRHQSPLSTGAACQPGAPGGGQSS